LNSNNFNNLTNSLSDSEKKSLLNQISENLTANPVESDEKYSSFKEKENIELKKKSLKEEVEHLGFIQRIILNIRSFLMGKDIMEVYNTDLLNNLERKILYSAPSLVLLKKRRFSSVIISDFSKIYSLVSPFIPHFNDIWESPIALEKLIGTIISGKYNSSKDSLYDFLRESEIDEYIAKGEDLESVKKRLVRAIYEYRKKIPEFIFPESEQEFLSIIALKNIVLYNYTPMFKLMGISPGDSYNEIASKTVSMSLVVKYLEEFYKLLIHFSGVNLQKNCITSLVTLSSSNEEGEEETLWENFNNLSDRLKKLTLSYPFEDIIKFAKNNPFYKIDYTASKINIEEFYFSALKKEMLADLVRVFEGREKAVVDTLFDSLFLNFETISLSNYAYTNDFNFKELGLTYFKYIDLVNILMNFIKFYYIREYKDIMFVLSKHVFEKNHMLQTKALELSIGVETLLERILKFDKSLSPDNEVGKTMKTLFSAVSSSKQNIRMYKAFIKQKDEEILELIKIGVKLLGDLEKILIQTLKSPSDSVKLQVSAIHPSISRKSTFRDVLTDKIKELNRFLDIFNKKLAFDITD